MRLGGRVTLILLISIRKWPSGAVAGQATQRTRAAEQLPNLAAARTARRRTFATVGPSHWTVAPRTVVPSHRTNRVAPCRTEQGLKTG